jgi:hypothetical protein
MSNYTTTTTAMYNLNDPIEARAANRLKRKKKLKVVKSLKNKATALPKSDSTEDALTLKITLKVT